MALGEIVPSSALLIIDIQNDFCPGGSLEVPEGDTIIPVVNQLAHTFPFVVATKDWHPEGHISFASRHEGKQPAETIDVDGLEQILWPDHCIQGSEGAEFHRDLDVKPLNLILHKGTKRDLDSYSAFFENDKETPTGLEFLLQGHGFERVFVCGLAEDVCVYFTARDARQLNLETYVISDATRGVNVPEGNLENAREDMKNAGVEFVESKELLS